MGTFNEFGRGSKPVQAVEQTIEFPLIRAAKTRNRNKMPVLSFKKQCLIDVSMIQRLCH